MKRLVFLLVLIFKGQGSEVPKGLLGAGGWAFYPGKWVRDLAVLLPRASRQKKGDGMISGQELGTLSEAETSAKETERLFCFFACCRTHMLVSIVFEKEKGCLELQPCCIWLLSGNRSTQG